MLITLSRHTKFLIFWGVVTAVLVVGVSVFFPWQYSAVTQVLIISRDRSGVDPYTQSKAAERVGESLVEIMKTSDFFGKVMKSTAVSFDKTRWSTLSDRDSRKAWQRDVAAEVVYGTSLLRITAYGPTQTEAMQFSEAVADTLTGRGWEYIGGDVVLKEVDRPLVSRLPVRPNFGVNAVAGFVIGVLGAALWVIKRQKHGLFGG